MSQQNTVVQEQPKVIKSPKQIDLNQFYSNPYNKLPYPFPLQNFPMTLPPYFPLYGCTSPLNNGFFNGFKSPRQNRVKKLDIYSFNLDQKIGQGYSSVVYRGKNDKTNEEVCIKIIDYLTLQNPSEKLMIENQIQCLKKLKSQNILRLLDVLQSKQFCYIITQMCSEGDLFKILHRKKQFSQSQLIPILKGIAYALLQLKTKNIIHRDLKPSNVLMKGNTPKLADFGFAIQQQYLSQKQKFNLGSPIYMSLQVLKFNKYSYSSDIFAYGIMAYQLLHRITPWESETQQQLLLKVENDPIVFKQDLSQSLKQLIRRCLEHDPAKRITIQQVINSSLFT